MHHSVTSSAPEATEAAERAHIAAIDAAHVRNGWGGFGYHYAVFPSGRVYRTGWGQRAHVAGRNHELVGIAWIADLSFRAPNEWEVAFAADAVGDVWRRLGNDALPVRGHGSWALPGAGTACPGAGREVLGDVWRRAHQIVMGKGALNMVTEQEVRAIAEEVASQLFLPLLRQALGVDASTFSDDDSVQRIRAQLTAAGAAAGGDRLEAALNLFAEAFDELADGAVVASSRIHEAITALKGDGK